MWQSGNFCWSRSDLHPVNCEQARIGLSARLDGEATALESDAVQAHLDGCEPCRRWQDDAIEIGRRLRVRPADELLQGDLVRRVLDAQRDTAPSRAASALPTRQVARVLLAVVAVAQLALSLPALLLGDDVAASLHVAHEVGATEAALALGVLAAAWRPWRAAGMLPVVAALAVGLLSTTATDVLGGEVPAVHELPHLLAVAEAVLLWRMRHRPAPAAEPGSGQGRALRSVA